MIQKSKNGILISYSSPRLTSGVSALLVTEVVFAVETVTFLSIPGIWIQAILIGGVAILAARIRWWLGLPFMILPAVIALSTLGLRLDPQVAPTIIKAHGTVYFQYFYASALLATLMVIAGMWMGWRRRKPSKSQDVTK